MPKLTESYLIRLWRDSTHSPWRASLQKIRSGELAYFACPEELWAYLKTEMGNKPDRWAEVEDISGVKSLHREKGDMDIE